MAVFKYVYAGLLAVIGFFIGSFAWSALAGVIGGTLAGVGIVVAPSTLLMASPAAGVVTAGYAATRVIG